MPNKNDGGPAFPKQGSEFSSSEQNGMSLREWFAGMALQGLLAADAGTYCQESYPAWFETDNHKELVKVAFEIADAAIAEKDRQ